MANILSFSKIQIQFLALNLNYIVQSSQQTMTQVLSVSLLSETQKVPENELRFTSQVRAELSQCGDSQSWVKFQGFFTLM